MTGRDIPADRKTRVFLSYSRKDIAFADRLVAALEARDIEVLIDRRDLPDFEDWKRELEDFIRASDTVVFVVSPHSLNSPVCQWELDQVATQNKRLAPVVLAKVPDDRIPESISRLNYIPFDPPNDFEIQAGRLAKALSTDIGWIREHTRLAGLARRWQERGSGGALVLRGQELDDAQRWLGLRPNGAPEPTAAQVAFLQGSRRAATRRQRLWVTGSLCVAAVTAVLGTFAFIQKQEADARRVEAVANAELAGRNAEQAERNARTAEANAAAARASEDRAIAELARAQRNESLALAEQALREVDNGDAIAGMRKAIEGLPKDLAVPDRPPVQRTEFALSKALLANRLIAVRKPAEDQVNHAVLSPDGRMIAAATRDGVTTIYDAASGTALHIFNDKRAATLALAFSADGRLLASAHQRPASILVRDTATGALRAELTLGTQAGHLLFLPDNDNRLISLSVNTDVKPRLWDLKTQRQLAVFDTVLGGLTHVRSAMLTPDGRFLAVTTFSEEALFVWDVRRRQLVMSNARTMPSQADEKAAVKFDGIEEEEIIYRSASVSNDGRILLVGKKTVYVVDPSRRAVVHHWRFASEWNAGGPNLLLTSSDGKLALVTPTNTELAVHDVAGGARRAFLRGNASRITAAAMSPDARLVASAAEDQSIRVWDVATEQQVLLLRDGEAAVRNLEFSKDGTRLISYGGDVVRIWDVRPDEQRFAAAPPDGWQLKKVDGGGALAVARRRQSSDRKDNDDADSALGIVNLSSGQLVHEVPFSRPFELDVNDAVVARDAPVVVVRRNGPREEGSSVEDYLGYEVFDLRQDEARRLLELRPPKSVSGTGSPRMTLSADGKWLGLTWYRYGDDGEEGHAAAEIWDLAALRRIFAHEQPGYDPHLRMSTEGSAAVLATQLRNGNPYEHVVSIWNLSTGVKTAELRSRMRNSSSELMLLDRARRVLTGGGHGIPALWDMGKGVQVGAIAGKRLSASRVLIANSRKHLLVAPDRGSWSLWHLPTRKLLTYLPRTEAASVQAAFSGDGRRILVREFTGDNTSWRFSLFNAASGERIREIGVFPASNTLDAYAGYTGRFVAIRTGLTTAEIHEVDSGKAPVKIVLKGSLYRWRMTDGDRRLVTATRDGTIQLWDSATGSLLTEITGGSNHEPIGPYVENQRRVPIVLADGTAKVMDTATGELLWRSNGGDLVEARLAPDENTVVTVSPQQVELISIASRERLGTFPLQAARLNSILFNATADRAFVHVRNGGSVLFDVRNKTVLGSYPDVDHAAMAGDGGSLVALGRGSLLELVDLATGGARHSVRFEKPIRMLRAGPQAATFAVATSDAKVFVVDSEGGRPTQPIQLRRLPTWLNLPTAKGEVLIMEDGGRVTLRNTANGAIIGDFPSDWHYTGNFFGSWMIGADPSGAYVAVRSPDQYVHIYRTSDGSRASFFNWDDRQINDFAFSQNGRFLVVAADSGELVIWNVQAGKGEKMVALPGRFFSHFSGASRFSLHGSQMIVPDGQGRVHVLSFNTFDLRTFYAGQPEEDVTGALSPDGTLLATVSKAGTVRVWHVGLAEVLLETRLAWTSSASGLTGLRFSADGKRLIVEPQFQPMSVLALSTDGEAAMTQSRAMLAALPAMAARSVQSAPTYRLGVVTSGVTPALASRYGLSAGDGALIVEVLVPSSALDAGLRIGDVILSLDGNAVRGHAALPKIVRSAPTNKDVEIAFLRDGRRRTTRVRLGGP